MNKVLYLRPQEPLQSAFTDDEGVSPKLLKSAVAKLMNFARAQGLADTAMALELALTAVEVDYERRRA